MSVTPEHNTAICDVNGNHVRVNFQRLKPYKGKLPLGEAGCHNPDFPQESSRSRVTWQDRE